MFSDLSKHALDFTSMLASEKASEAQAGQASASSWGWNFSGLAAWDASGQQPAQSPAASAQSAPAQNVRAVVSDALQPNDLLLAKARDDEQHDAPSVPAGTLQQPAAPDAKSDASPKVLSSCTASLMLMWTCISALQPLIIVIRRRPMRPAMS